MKKATFFLLFIIHYSLFIASSSFAQHGGNYSSGNQSAVRAFEQAQLFYGKSLDDKALDALKSTLEKDSNFVEAWTMKGNILEDHKKYQEASDCYKKALAIKPDFFSGTYLSLATSEFKLAHYEDAKADLQKFITLPDIKKPSLDRANFLLSSCNFSIEAMKHPVPFKPVNLGDSINTKDDEVLPTITADGKYFLFTRQGPGKDMYGYPSRLEDFYMSEKKNGHWSHAVPVKELNTEGNEGASCFSPDGQYLFFTGCESNYGYPEGREKGLGSCDLYISKKVGDKFQTPRDLGPPVNTNGYETQPSFSSDGRTLYFIRKVKNADGKLNQDIYVTFIDDYSQWSEPMPLPPNINTPGDEFSVFIHPDNQTLYFSSDGHPGFGDLDIFVSHRQSDGSWGDPINLGYPINTSGREVSLLVAPDGKVAYFSANNRPDGRGGMDIYQFDLPDTLQPQKITYMKGIVYDAETKQPLSASFELIDLATAKTVVRSSSNPGNGEFLVCLPSGKSYALNVAKDGYLFYSDNFELKNAASVKEPYMKDVPMKPIKEGQSVVLKNVFYEVDKYDLKQESGAELQKIMGFMKKNPKVKVEISGHTDNTGTKQHNQLLSENRARTVYEYLIANGVDKNRLAYKGYADDKPIASNNTEAGKAKNRRTEFTITSVN